MPSQGRTKRERRGAPPWINQRAANPVPIDPLPANNGSQRLPSRGGSFQLPL